MQKLYNDGVTFIKKLIYGKRGEPFPVGNKTLLYLPGTRPTKFKYIDSADITVRNDVKQMKYFVDMVKKSNFVLDVGGHVGQYAVLFASLVGRSGKVVTFEPDIAAIKVLHQNLQLNGFTDKVTVENIALSDSNGTHTFFSMGGDSMSSLVRSGLGSNATSSDVQEYSIRTMKMDDYLSANGLGFPDWIKLDTEGAEINILKGAQDVLKSKAVILCELHPYAWAEFGTSYSDLLSIVKQSGRKMRYLDGSLKFEDGPHYGTVII